MLPFFLPSSCRRPSEYVATVLELSALVTKRHNQIFLYSDLLYYLTPDGKHFRRACRLVHDFTDAVIQERRRTLPDQGIDDFLKAKAKTKTLDFIDVLLLTKVGFSGISIHEIEWILTSNVRLKDLNLMHRALDRVLREGK